MKRPLKFDVKLISGINNRFILNDKILKITNIVNSFLAKDTVQRSILH